MIDPFWQTTTGYGLGLVFLVFVVWLICAAVKVARGGCIKNDTDDS